VFHESDLFIGSLNLLSKSYATLVILLGSCCRAQAPSTLIQPLLLGTGTIGIDLAKDRAYISKASVNGAVTSENFIIAKNNTHIIPIPNKLTIIHEKKSKKIDHQKSLFLPVKQTSVIKTFRHV
jgi:hypothetical protein